MCVVGRVYFFVAPVQEFAEARLYELWLKERRLATREEVGLVNTEEVGGNGFVGRSFG